MKSYTDLEQSKALAKILPIESADICYVCGNIILVSPIKYGNTSIEELYKKHIIPAWSLAALLGVLNKSAYFANEAGIVELSSIKATRWCVSILNCGKIENCYADEPIDACVAMVEKLNELTLL